MTHTIELAPEVERALEAKAARHGITVDDLLRALAEAEAARATMDPATVDSTTAEVTAEASIADVYAQSLATGGDLTALSSVQEDLHEYTTEELAAMEAGEFGRPVDTRRTRTG